MEYPIQTSFTDLLNILPDSFICRVSAPSIDSVILLQVAEFDNKTADYLIEVDSQNRHKLLSLTNKYSIEEQIHEIVISLHSKVLFQGYDGFDTGIISKNLKLPDWFREKYIETELWKVSEVW
jgi:hypothetical protein